MSLKNKHMDEEIRAWIYNWDRVRISDKLKHRISLHDPHKLLEAHMMKDEHRSIHKGELALLINAERFITVLDYRSKWEIEMDVIEERNQTLVKDNAELKLLVDYLRDKAFDAELVAKSRETENANYTKIIKSLNSRLHNSHKESKEVQTLLDCQNVKFTEKADNLFKSKAQREHKPIFMLMKKVKNGNSKLTPLSLTETMNLIALVYGK